MSILIDNNTKVLTQDMIGTLGTVFTRIALA